MKTKLLILALFLSLAGNAVFAVKYRALWYDSAQAEGLLDECNATLRNATQ